MVRFPLQIKTILALLFIVLIVLSNQLFVPHMAVIGLIFLDGNVAFSLTAMLFLLVVVAIPGVVRRQGYSFYILSFLLGAISLNSFLNIMSAIFLREDVAGFIIRVFGNSEYLPGFLINQALLFGLGVITLKMLFNKKNWFKGLLG